MKAVRVFLAQRLEKIRNLLIQQRSIDNATLSELLEVSEVTIRKDLEKLEKMGFLRRIHGGAVISEDETSSDSIEDITHYEEKIQIAKQAVDLVGENDSVFIGPGTTCTIFAKIISTKDSVRVVTNNIDAVKFLTPSIKHVFLIGGNISGTKDSIFSTGQSEHDYFKGIFVNKAFFSVDGVDKDAGLTVNDIAIAKLITTIQKLARETIILADHTKFGSIAIHQTGEIDSFNYVITNQNVEEKYEQLFFERNSKLITAIEL